MSMKYFYLFLIFFILLMFWQVIKYVILKRFFYTCVLKKSLWFYSVSDHVRIFSSYIWLKVADLYSGFSCRKKEEFIQLLENKEFERIIKYVEDKNLGLSYTFGVCVGLKKNIISLKQYINKEPNDVDALIGLAFVYAEDFSYLKLNKVINKLKKLKLKKIEKAIVSILEAQIDMFEADMLSASKKVFKAISFFKKKNYLYEEAQAYVLLGEIYRVSAMYDVAQMMFDTAQKIYFLLNNDIKVADIKTLKAVLFMGQERFKEAKGLLGESQRAFEKYNLYRKYAEVLNQQALLYLLQNKYSLAIKTAQKSLDIHQKFKNMRGQGFSCELIALSEYNKKKYEKSFEYAMLSMSLYIKHKNYAAYEDSAFLAAQSCFALKRYEQAELICRKIITIHGKHSTCFHVANVYSLLGLIYIKLNDFNRASALLKQSLNLEQCNERYSAAAIDYVNLALIDKKCGRMSSAMHNLQSALDSAKKQNDDELCEIIEKQIKKIEKF